MALEVELDPVRDAVDYTVPRWYATYTSARHEKRVAEELARRTVDVYLPLYEAVRRWKDRRKLVQLPLFPGYVFVHLPLKDRLRVLQIPGVVRFVGFNGHAIALESAEIETLRNGLSQRLRAEPHPYLTAGRRVRIRNGAFQGLEGILLRHKGVWRVVVSIHLIMRSVAIEVDASEVEPLL